MDASMTATMTRPAGQHEEYAAHTSRDPRLATTRRPLLLNGFGGFAAADVDTARANTARMDDYLRDGKDNYQVDRDAAEEIKALLGERGPALVRANRAYLADAVRAAAEDGVRQVLDIGAGLSPATARAAAQAAQTAGSATRVVLVDHDPVILVHLQAQWERSNPPVRSAALYGDLLWPEETFLGDPRLFDVLHWEEPILVVLGAVLHHLPDERAARSAVARLMRAVPAGSRLVITHAAADQTPPEAEEWARCYRDAEIPLVPRTREQIARFFDGLIVKEAGAIPFPASPEQKPELSWMFGAAGCTP